MPFGDKFCSAAHNPGATHNLYSLPRFCISGEPRAHREFVAPDRAVVARRRVLPEHGDVVSDQVQQGRERPELVLLFLPQHLIGDMNSPDLS